MENLLKNLISFIHFLRFISTSASVERSFSTMERIHTFARDTQSALLSIEKGLLNTLMESTISDFCDK